MSCQIDEKNVFSSHLRILFKYVVNSYLNIDECSSLLCVSTIEDFDIVNLLGISLRFDDDHALRYASGCGHLPVVQYLVEKGADIHVMHDYSLRVAVKENHLHVVRFLVENGANIYIYIYIYIYTCNDCFQPSAENRFRKRKYALRYASDNGRLDIVRYLVEKGVNIHTCNDYALKHASEYGHLPVVQYLLENGVNIHVENDYALRIASSKGNLHIVRFLVENGADIHACNNRARKIASEKGHRRIVKYFSTIA